MTRRASAGKRAPRQLQTFAEVIALWPRTTELADDCELSPHTVYSWIRRDNVPPQYWRALVRSAAERNIPGVTYQLLENICTRKHQDRLQKGGSATVRTQHRVVQMDN